MFVVLDVFFEGLTGFWRFHGSLRIPYEIFDFDCNF
jgi:hypothetical protein